MPEPRTDFNTAENVREMGLAISRVAESLGWSLPLRIGERELDTARAIQSLNPSAPAEVIATFPMSGAPEIDAALAEAERAGADWKRVPMRERGAILERTAESLRLRRFELAAWICFETGLTWRRADEEVAGAIDALFEAAGVDSLGTCAVITPSGSPFESVARLCGEALLAGDPVVLKPARGTPLTAWKLVDALRDAGLPDGVLTMLPGHGDEIVPLLLSDRRVRHAVFSGSYLASLAIAAASGEDRPLRLERRAPRLIFVHAPGDLDQVIANVHGVGPWLHTESRIRDEIVAALQERLDSLTMGPSIDLASEIGPLPDAEAFRAALAWAGQAHPPTEQEGYFVEPVILTGSTLRDSPLLGDRPGHLIALSQHSLPWAEPNDCSGPPTRET